MANHLQKECSTYLQRHISDLVDWYPWGEDALVKSRDENKAIFLSIGYSSSHWCQVMQEESFANEATAKLLNKHFVAIKVDKEERPDLDKYFQKVYQLMNQRPGGWPTSIFLTDDLKPFYSATYIPSEPSYGMMSFSSLLEVIADRYQNEKALLVEKADEIVHFLNPKEENIQATKLDLSIIGRVTEQAKQLFDSQYGGFNKAPKFPQTTLLDLLLDVYQLTKNKETLDMALFSLTAMAAQGGLKDAKDGGFYAYCKDNEWLVPHPSKMTYDNALLSQVYLKAYHISGDTFYKTVAFETIDFMLKNMREGHLFFASSTAGTHTFVDNKILVSWNAMMIKSLFKASRTEEHYLKPAVKSLDALLESMYINSELFHSTLLGKKPKIKAYLEDYAYLCDALIEAYESTLDETYLITATKLANSAIEKYFQHGKWKFSRGELETFEQTHDSAYPSSVSVMLRALFGISSLVDSVYKKFIFKTLEYHSYEVMRQPISSPLLSHMVIRYLKNDVIIKASEKKLKKHLNELDTLTHPFSLFRNDTNDGYMLCNTLACFGHEKHFSGIVEILAKR